MSNTKRPYSGKVISYNITLPQEWDDFIKQITKDPSGLIKHLIASELFNQGMINIEPEFENYEKLFRS